jgi:hypothetical protein
MRFAGYGYAKMSETSYEMMEIISTNPRLTRMVSHVPDMDTCFLPHFSCNSVLKSFSRLNEASKSRVELVRISFLRERLSKDANIVGVSQLTPLPRRILSPVSSMAIMMTTGSVRGWVKLCKPFLYEYISYH